MSEDKSIWLLSAELWLMIFREVQLAKSSDLRNASLVCKQWHSFACQLLASYVDVDAMSFKSMKIFMKNLLNNDGAHNQLRGITVRDGYVVEALPYVFDNISGHSAPKRDLFQQFHSSGPEKSGYSNDYDAMTKEIFNRLSSLRLKSFIWNSVSSDSSLFLQAMIAQSANSLAELDIQLDRTNKSLWESLAALLNQTQRLRHLSIQATYPNPRRSEWSVVPLLPEISCQLRLKTCRLVNICLCKDGKNSNWSLLADWRTIQEAEFTCPTFLIHHGSKMDCLYSLALSLDERYPKILLNSRVLLSKCCPWTHSYQEIANAVIAVPALKHLEIRNSIQSLSEILNRHGSLLQKLCIREDQPCAVSQSAEDDVFRILPDENLLLQIAVICTELQDLSLDAPTDWPLLSHFCNLVAKNLYFVHRLTLNFETPCYQSVPSLKIGYDKCRDIWRILTENMQLNNYFKLIITAGAPISWDRARWSRAPWYYKKRTYLVDPPSDESSEIQVTCHELTRCIYLMEDDALDSSRISIPIADVEYLVKYGEPRSPSGLAGWTNLQEYSCLGDRGLTLENKRRLLQAHRDRLPSLH